MSNWTQQDIDACIAKCQEKAVLDADFRAKLIADPAKAVKDLTGMDLPAGIKIKVLESDPDSDYTFLLPDAVSGAIDEAGLDDVVGGGSCGTFTTKDKCANYAICNNDNEKGTQGKAGNK